MCIPPAVDVRLLACDLKSFTVCSSCVRTVAGSLCRSAASSGMAVSIRPRLSRQSECSAVDKLYAQLDHRPPSLLKCGLTLIAWSREVQDSSMWVSRVKDGSSHPSRMDRLMTALSSSLGCSEAVLKIGSALYGSQGPIVADRAQTLKVVRERPCSLSHEFDREVTLLDALDWRPRVRITIDRRAPSCL